LAIFNAIFEKLVVAYFFWGHPVDATPDLLLLNIQHKLRIVQYRYGSLSPASVTCITFFH